MAAGLQDHELASCYRLMKGDEFAKLVASMKRRGFDPAHPIWLYEGKVLDGRNRYRAAMAAGVVPVVKEWSGEGSPAAFVLQENDARRHESDPAVRAAAVIALSDFDAAWKASQAEKKLAADKARADSQRGVPKERAGSQEPARSEPRKPDSYVRTADELAKKAEVSLPVIGQPMTHRVSTDLKGTEYRFGARSPSQPCVFASLLALSTDRTALSSGIYHARARMYGNPSLEPVLSVLTSVKQRNCKRFPDARRLNLYSNPASTCTHPLPASGPPLSDATLNCS